MTQYSLTDDDFYVDEDGTNKELVTYLLNLANDMRAEKNSPLLADLPEAVPQDSEQCIIANAFNYGCSVDPSSEIITFQSEADRNTYCKVMGIVHAGLVKDPDYYEHYGTDDDGLIPEYHTYRDPDGNKLSGLYCDLEAPMTDELVRIAMMFDEGTLFTEYVYKPDYR